MCVAINMCERMCVVINVYVHSPNNVCYHKQACVVIYVCVFVGECMRVCVY